MKYLLSSLFVIICASSIMAQEFSLINDESFVESSSFSDESFVKPSDTPTISQDQLTELSNKLQTLSSESISIENNSSQLITIPITILLTNFAEVRDVEGGQKAVFIGTTSLTSYNGIMVKIPGSVTNPLLRIYKRPNLFPPTTMKKYSNNEWFYYGEPGEYIIEFLDSGENGWNSEFAEVTIKGGTTNKPVDNPVDKPVDNPVDNPGGDYKTIRSKTAQMVKDINDPTVANSLIKEYTTVMVGLTGSIDEMRIKVRDARRAAFQNVPSRNANWNNILIKIDQMMIEAGVDTIEEYKAALKSYVDGIGDGLK